MITQNDIHRLGLPTIEAYYQQIVYLYSNGQAAQIRKLIKRLSQPQKKAFLEWFDETYLQAALDNIRPFQHHNDYAYYTMIILS